MSYNRKNDYTQVKTIEELISTKILWFKEINGYYDEKVTPNINSHIFSSIHWEHDSNGTRCSRTPQPWQGSLWIPSLFSQEIWLEMQTHPHFSCKFETDESLSSKPSSRSWYSENAGRDWRVMLYAFHNLISCWKRSKRTSARLKSVARTTIHSLNFTEHIWANRNSASNRLCNIPIWSWKHTIKVLRE